MFSLGLTLLQLGYMCNSQELKEIRSSQEKIKYVVMNNLQQYSENIKCLILIMLKWESEERPDFI